MKATITIDIDYSKGTREEIGKALLFFVEQCVQAENLSSDKCSVDSIACSIEDENGNLGRLARSIALQTRTLKAVPR